MNKSNAVAIGMATVMLGAGTWGVVEAASAESTASTTAHSVDRKAETLTVQWEMVGFKAVDLGREGDSPGDFFLFSQEWYNEAGTRLIGKALARCEIGLPAKRRTCDVTGRLKGRGKIRFGGTVFGDQDTVSVVTGGTGDFRGVDGVVHVRATRPLFVFRFVR